jgi:hypothetical protein
MVAFLVVPIMLFQRTRARQDEAIGQRPIVAEPTS